MKGTYRGKPIEEMSREELIDALEQMSGLYMAALKQHNEDLELFKINNDK